MKYILSGLCAVLAMASCINTLDTSPVDSFDDAAVWGDRAGAESFIYVTYEQVLSLGFGAPGSSIQWQARTPDGVHSSNVGDDARNYDAFTLDEDIPYVDVASPELLRRCNMIIEKIAEANLDEETKTQLQACGYLCRGLVFFHGARSCGRFVPITKLLDQDDEEAATVPMTKDVAESYTYVIADLQKAADGMPERSDAGLPNRYAACVLLSRAALQAYAYTNDASYLDIAINAAKEVTESQSLTSNYANLFNQNGANDPEILWAYYRKSDNTTMRSFPELMRMYPNIKLGDLQSADCPAEGLMMGAEQTFECWGVYWATQDLVDQYLVIDEQTGKAVNWWESSQWVNNTEELPTEGLTVGCIDQYEKTSGDGDRVRRLPSAQDLREEDTKLAHASEGYTHFKHYAKLKDGVTGVDISDLMYNNRDRRMDGTIVRDKSTWLGAYIETRHKGNMSQGIRDNENGGWYCTSTGYYFRKGVGEPDTKNGKRAFLDTNLDAHYVIARTGEAYMNLAEAYLLKNEISNAVEALNATRKQHGGLPESTASTAAEAWADYMRERRVEMANECGDVYYSYLRWGKYGGYSNYDRAPGDEILDLDRPVYKIQISSDRSTILINQNTISRTAQRRFTVRRYLRPIKQSFLDTREAYGLDHEQTQGW